MSEQEQELALNILLNAMNEVLRDPSLTFKHKGLICLILRRTRLYIHNPTLYENERKSPGAKSSVHHLTFSKKV